MLQVPLAQLEPKLPYIMIAFILVSIMIGLYIYFGFNFIWKGKQSKNEAQKSYYKGLGAFIITVALSESVYLVDYMWRVLYGYRIFREMSDYSEAIGHNVDTLFPSDYYIVIFMLLSVGLMFLTSPVEKYLLARKRKVLTISSAVVFPAPLLARYLELNIPVWFNTDIKSTSLYYMITSAVWLVNIGVLSIAILLLFSLYLKMGLAAPPGSKLRKKSRMIVFGLIFWITAIFSTSSVLKEIWNYGDKYLPGGELYASFGYLYNIFPFIIPTLMILSLALTSYGFTREY